MPRKCNPVSCGLFHLLSLIFEQRTPQRSMRDRCSDEHLGLDSSQGPVQSNSFLTEERRQAATRGVNFIYRQAPFPVDVLDAANSYLCHASRQSAALVPRDSLPPQVRPPRIQGDSVPNIVVCRLQCHALEIEYSSRAIASLADVASHSVRRCSHSAHFPVR
jgi:hypothetical protein